MMLRSRAFDWGLSFSTRVADAFSPTYLDRLRGYVMESPYLAANNLNYRFSGTRGWSVVFRQEGLERVRAEFPLFSPYLDAVIDDDANAWFLNPLVLAAAAPGEAPPRVAPHIDRSLRSFTLPIEPPNPRRVTVLYVDVPDGMQGGVLRLFHRVVPVGRVRPRRNTLVQFQGWLRHDVTPASLPPGTCRVSLVCEHYMLEDEALARVPGYTVRSMTGFDGFLDAELARAEENESGDAVDGVPADAPEGNLS